jgi:hypothetical protein
MLLAGYAFVIVALLAQSVLTLPRPTPAQAAPTSYPILFVTQVPIRADFTTIVATFGNHRGDLSSAPRGGDLWIQYPNGNRKNLTLAAGYGSADAFQGAEAIAVRDPAVHWDGTKALFSMVVGAPTQRYQVQSYRWQIYEITGLGENDTPVITKLSNQPTEYNNISPIYATDDQIIFTSDRPRNGQAHLYPQLDEYELAPTNSGLWRLNPATGALQLLNHAPSGNFSPSIDSYGRVIFTQWDHLQRDQQADADARGTGSYGTFDYSDESATATILPTRSETFPEPRPTSPDLTAESNLAGHTFNQFFPWQINEDGTEAETLNHIGRQELHGYVPMSRTDDDNLYDYYGQYTRTNQNEILNMFQIREDPLNPGRYYAIDAPEFGTHGSGQVIRLDAQPTLNPDDMQVVYITHRDTSRAEGENAPANPNHSGFYRDILPRSDETLLAAHTSETRQEAANGASRYDFRLKTLTNGSNGYLQAGTLFTTGIAETVEWWSPDTYESYSGELWELQPVEVRSRTRPTKPAVTLPAPELAAFTAAGVDVEELQQFLREQNLALVIVRDVTVRDDFDRQQPFNLRVPDGEQTIGASGTIYDVSHMQFYQAEQLRGWTGSSDQPRPGRRVLARPMRATAGLNPIIQGPDGSVLIAADGSVAAFVPAGRATSWQIVGPGGEAIVRERYWLTFQAGEIRTCNSCHGQNKLDQAGQSAPTNTPAALQQLLAYWKATGGEAASEIFLPLIQQ